jgi:hypothetical protein
MRDETLYLVLTYEGDRTEQLKQCGDRGMRFRLNQDGDTELITRVEHNVMPISATEYIEMIEQDTLAAAREFGQIKTHRWLIKDELPRDW